MLKIITPQGQKGKLVIAGNAIGCDEDIPRRSLDFCQSADLVVFEGARGARKVLKKAGIHREFQIFSEHHEIHIKELICENLKVQKTVLYMSDQGMPSVSDPGLDLVQLAFESKAGLQVVPGPSSITSAISVCPFSLEKFFFYGFLPQKEEERKKEFQQKITPIKYPVILMDAPYRLKSLLKLCLDNLENNREIFLALDISGENESYFFGTVNDFKQDFSKIEGLQKENFILIINKSDQVK